MAHNTMRRSLRLQPCTLQLAQRHAARPHSHPSIAQALRRPHTPSTLARSGLRRDASRRAAVTVRADGFSPMSQDGSKAAGAEYPGSEHVIPTRLNNTPHERETRTHFYQDVTRSVIRAVADGVNRQNVVCIFPELNMEMDVYRVGTLLECMRVMATALAQDGKRVKVCVQGSMGQGVFQGLPLSLNGVRRIMELMDWGEGMLGERIVLGAVGADEVESEDDVFVIICPTSIVGNSIIPPMLDMCKAAGDRPVIVFNQRMGDLPSSGGVMGVQGRKERLEFIASFETVYHFRLLYNKPYWFPIYGALRKLNATRVMCGRQTYAGPWDIFKRVIKSGEESYNLVESFDDKEPNPEQITKAIRK